MQLATYAPANSTNSRMDGWKDLHKHNNTRTQERNTQTRASDENTQTNRRVFTVSFPIQELHYTHSLHATECNVSGIRPFSTRRVRVRVPLHVLRCGVFLAMGLVSRSALMHGKHMPSIYCASTHIESTHAGGLVTPLNIRFHAHYTATHAHHGDTSSPDNGDSRMFRFDTLAHNKLCYMPHIFRVQRET